MERDGRLGRRLANQIPTATSAIPVMVYATHRGSSEQVARVCRQPGQSRAPPQPLTTSGRYASARMAPEAINAPARPGRRRPIIEGDAGP